MRYAAAVLFLFTGSVALAQTSYEDNRLDTLHHRTEAGRFYVYGGGEGRIRETQTASSNGQVTEYKRSSLQTDLQLNYGVTDALWVSVGESYLNRFTTDSTNVNSGTSHTFNISGISDPVFEADYRLLGGLSGSSFVNAALALRPAVGSAQGDDIGRDGNNLSPNSLIRAQVSYNGVSGRQEWYGRVGLTYFTSGTENDVNPNASVTYDSHIQEFLSGSYRFHFADRLFAQASLTVDLPYYQDQASANASSRVNHEMVLTPQLSGGWLLCDHALATAGVSYTDFRNQMVSNPSGRETDSHYNRSYWNVGLSWLF